MAASLTNQDDEPGQAAASALAEQAGWLARPRLELRPSHSVFSWALEFFPLIEMIYESKKNSKIQPSVKHMTYEMFFWFLKDERPG